MFPIITILVGLFLIVAADQYLSFSPNDHDIGMMLLIAGILLILVAIWSLIAYWFRRLHPSRKPQVFGFEVLPPDTSDHSSEEYPR